MMWFGKHLYEFDGTFLFLTIKRLRYSAFSHRYGRGSSQWSLYGSECQLRAASGQEIIVFGAVVTGKLAMHQRIT